MATSRVRSKVLGVRDLWFRVSGSGFKVAGSGFTISGCYDHRKNLEIGRTDVSFCGGFASHYGYVGVPARRASLQDRNHNMKYFIHRIPKIF